MSQGPLCPNLTQKVQKEVSQMANRNLPRPILLGGLSVNLNHLKTATLIEIIEYTSGPRPGSKSLAFLVSDKDYQDYRALVI